MTDEQKAAASERMKAQHAAKKAAKEEAKEAHQEKDFEAPDKLIDNQAQVFTAEPEIQQVGDYYEIELWIPPRDWGSDPYSRYIKLGCIDTGKRPAPDVVILKIHKDQRELIQKTIEAKDKAQRLGVGNVSLGSEVTSSATLSQLPKSLAQMASEYGTGLGEDV